MGPWVASAHFFLLRKKKCHFLNSPNSSKHNSQAYILLKGLCKCWYCCSSIHFSCRCCCSCRRRCWRCWRCCCSCRRRCCCCCCCCCWRCCCCYCCYCCCCFSCCTAAAAAAALLQLPLLLLQLLQLLRCCCRCCCCCCCHWTLQVSVPNAMVVSPDYHNHNRIIPLETAPDLYWNNWKSAPWVPAHTGRWARWLLVVLRDDLWPGHAPISVRYAPVELLLIVGMSHQACSIGRQRPASSMPLSDDTALPARRKLLPLGDRCPIRATLRDSPR